jgi:hypothetical protein
MTLRTVLPAALAMLLAIPAAAELTAEQIVDKAMNRGSVGFAQGTATLEMAITDPRGDKKVNTIEIKAMRNEDKLLRSLVRFTKPAKIAGVSFLVREKKDQLPDQYVFVPAAKVVRRVAAGNAGSSFFGSDFTYGDLMPLPASQMGNLGLKKLADAEVGGQPVHVLEIEPKIEGSPYGKLVVHVHRKHMVPLKIEFFDPAKKALKTLTTKRLKKIDKELVPVELEMKNVQKGSGTVLKLLKINPKAKLSDADFTEEAMQR